jgi:multiple sugar transport system substrate-binding protein
VADRMPGRSRRCRGRSCLALLALVLATAGCARDPSPAPATPADQTLTLVSSSDGSQGGVTRQLVDQWNATHETKVRMIEMPLGTDLQHSQVLAAEQSGNSTYDVLNIDVAWTAELAEAGAIQSLPDAMVAGEGRNAFLPRPLQTVRYDKRVWAVPYFTDAGLLFYRSDILRHYKLQPPRTWPEIVDTWSAVHRFAQGRHTPAGAIKAAYVSQLARSEALTVNAMEAASAAGEDLMASGQVSQGLLNLADYVRTKAVLPESLDDDEAASVQAFRRGDALYMRNWPFAYNVLAATMRPGSFAVTTLPGPDAAHPGRPVLGGWNLAVAAHTRKPKLARDLITFLTSPASEQCLLERGGLAATRAGPYDPPGPTRPACTLPDQPGPVGSGWSEGGAGRTLYEDPDALRALRAALAGAQLRPLTPFYLQVSRVVRAVVSRMLSATTSAEAEQQARQLPNVVAQARHGS